MNRDSQMINDLSALIQLDAKRISQSSSSLFLKFDELHNGPGLRRALLISDLAEVIKLVAGSSDINSSTGLDVSDDQVRNMLSKAMSGL